MNNVCDLKNNKQLIIEKWFLNKNRITKLANIIWNFDST